MDGLACRVHSDDKNSPAAFKISGVVQKSFAIKGTSELAHCVSGGRLDWTPVQLHLHVAVSSVHPLLILVSSTGRSSDRVFAKRQHL